MVITSRDILRRRAGRRAGGNSKGKTVSWTTAVRKVSNQGQAGGQRHKLSSFAAPYRRVTAQLRHKVFSKACQCREEATEGVLDPGGALTNITKVGAAGIT